MKIASNYILLKKMSQNYTFGIKLYMSHNLTFSNVYSKIIHMNTIAYLKEVYGYDNPIILKNIRIGGLSKTALRQQLSRAYKKGEISRYSNGVYFIDSKTISPILGIHLIKVGFEDYIESKYIKNKNCYASELFINGYYSGQTFLNMMGISQQVPARKEITTNNTSSKKREIYLNGRYVILRKSRTEINFQNWKILQFLDMFHFLSDDDFIKNKKRIVNYIKNNKFTKNQLTKYISLYSIKTQKMIFETEVFYAFN